MTYTFTWVDAEQTLLKRECSESDAYAFIPRDELNRDYREYLEWVAEGNTPEPFDDTVTWQDIRVKRDGILRDTDWTMTPGCTVDQAQWAAYRQNLRDITSTYAETGPESVVWPVQPSTSGPNTIEE
jgi:hypothetical protein